MQGRKRASRGVLIGVVVSAAALVWVIRWAGWGQLWEALRGVDFRYLLLAMAVYLVSMIARVGAWHTLLGRSVSFWQVLAALNEGYLLNNVLPWRLGEVGRAVLLGRRPGQSVPRVLSSIMLERLMDMLLAVSLLLSVLPFVAEVHWAGRAAMIGGSALVAGVVLLWLMTRHSQIVERWVARLPGGGERWIRVWHEFRQGLMAVDSPRWLLLSMGWMILSWALAGVDYWLVLSSVIPSPRFLWAYFMLAITLLGVAVPSSPGYLGVFEAAGVAALAVFGVPGGQALAATLVLHGMVYALGSLFGAIALTREGETLMGLYSEIRGWLRSSEPGHAD